jgi:hypothetical protein
MRGRAAHERRTAHTPALNLPLCHSRHCDWICLALSKCRMATEIPVGMPCIVQHDLLGELAVDLKQVRRRPIYPQSAPETDLLDGEIRGTVQADETAVKVALCPQLVTDGSINARPVL